MKSLYTLQNLDYHKHLINVDSESLCIQVVRSMITSETRKSTPFNYGNLGTQELLTSLKTNCQHDPLKVIRSYHFPALTLLIISHHTWNKT